MKARRYIALFAVIALLGVFAWYAGHPAPDWYISPPLDAQGHRAKVRVPAGWRLDTGASHLPNGVLQQEDRFTLVFAPHETLLSRGFHRLLGRPATDASRLYVDLGRSVAQLGFLPTTPVDGREVLESLPMDPGWDGVSYRLLKVGQPPLIGAVAFTSPDKQTFDTMHATATGSFRIE